jgi:hypothetical protein
MTFLSHADPCDERGPRADAMGCQKAIVEKIVARGADYIYWLSSQTSPSFSMRLWISSMTGSNMALGAFPVNFTRRWKKTMADSKPGVIGHSGRWIG